MRFIDLLRMSVSNLWRRKLRTFLTVLGVIIGTASIVVMISLGLGLSKATMESIEQSGGLTTITVREGNGMTYASGAVAVATDSSEKDANAGKITDSTAEEIMAIPHVEIASPVLSLYPILKCGAYEANISIKAMTTEAFEAMDIPLAEGSKLPTDTDKLEFLYGNQVITNFYNSRTNQYYWETGELPDIDLANDPIFFIMDSDAYWNAKSGGMDANGNAVEQPKKYMYGSTGLVEGTPEDYNEYSWESYCNIEALKKELKKIFKNRPIPNQPTRSNGKPYKEWYYSEMYVRVDELENVMAVQQQINDMGYYAYSNAEWIEQTKNESAMIQAVLGGIGAVSMFVAAISIANTMMMSIYERTKEIGIMKVLGCSLGRIRDLFLMEAGFIGFAGGILGIALSYGISALLNVLLATSIGSISYIPVWLSGLALIFAVLIGMLAGLMPALRAMKLSALSALRNE